MASAGRRSHPGSAEMTGSSSQPLATSPVFTSSTRNLTNDPLLVIEQANATARHQRSALLAHNENLERENSRLIINLSAAEAKVLECNTTLSRIEAERVDLTAQLDAAECAAANQATVINQSQNHNGALAADLALTAEKLVRTESTAIELQIIRQQLESNLSAEKRRVRNHKATIGRVKRTLASTRVRLQDQDDLLDSLNADLVMEKGKVQDQADTITQLTVEKRDLRAQAETADGVILQRDATIDCLEEDISDGMKEKQALQVMFAELQETILLRMNDFAERLGMSGGCHETSEIDSGRKRKAIEVVERSYPSKQKRV